MSDIGTTTAPKPPVMRSLPWGDLETSDNAFTRTWNSVRRWGQNRRPKDGRAGEVLVYRRCAGFQVEVDQATHAEFVALTQDATAAWARVFDQVGDAVRKGLKGIPTDKQKVAGPTHYWPREVEAGILQKEKARLTANDFQDGDSKYVAVMAAAGRAMVSAKMDANYGMAPKSWWKTDCPPGMTVRLARGTLYHPLRQDADGLRLGDALLRPFEPYPHNCPEAAYAEFTHIRQVWRLRLVYVNCEPKM